MQSPALSPRQFEWTLLAYAATLLPFAFWLPLWFSGMLLGVLLARWLQRRRYAQAWPGWIKFPLLAALLIAVVTEYGNPASRPAGAALLMGLGTLKLIESERRRDSLLLLPVCLFLISIQFLFDQSIGITVLMLIPMFLTFLALNEVSAPAGTKAGLLEDVWRVGREVGVFLLVTVALTTFLFLSVPRLDAPLWGTRDDGYTGKTGLNDSMKPGSMTELLADDTPVMRARFDRPIIDHSSLYWRGPVLSLFDGENWLTSRELRAPLADAQRQLLRQMTPDVRYELVLEATDRRWLMALDMPIEIPDGATQNIDGQVVRANSIETPFAYSASARFDPALPTLALPDQQRRIGLQLPNGRNPRTRQLGQRWRAELGDNPNALVQRALQYIREEEFSYTLQPVPLVGAHRVDEFLFDTREGYCEHYASAFVVLMRSAGLSARVVTGYMGGYYNRAGDYYLIRNSDAHAWAEVLMSDGRWLRVDPTAAVSPDRVQRAANAGGSGDLFPDNAFLRAWRERVDNVRAWWNRTIVRFDAIRQRELFSGLGLDPNDWRQRLGWWAVGFGAIAIFAAIAFLMRQIPVRRDPALRRYVRYLKEMARLGHRAQPVEGARSFASRLSETAPQLRELALEVALAYEAARYAPATPDCQGRLERAIQRCLRAARATKRA